MTKREKKIILLILLFSNIFLVQSVLYSTGNELLPMTYDVDGSSMPSNLTGIIVLWNGNLNSIPDGWALCDGDNGTPNLTDKFVMSVGEFENPGATGGSVNHTHTYEELPYHDHAVSDPGHRHAINEKDGSVGPMVAQGILVYAYDYNQGSVTSQYKIFFNPDPAGIENCETEESSALPSHIKLSYLMKISNTDNPALPPNSILGWVNSQENIPEGWKLCNGLLNSPNLTERFIYSTTNSSEMNQTGGSKTHNHIYNDLPLHDHDVDIDPHDHTQAIPKASSGVLSGSDTTTLNDLAYSYTSSFEYSGINIMNTGLVDCESMDTSSFPPYFQISFIINNASSSFVPNQTIFWWANDLHNIPIHSSQFVGTPNSTVYNRFMLSTINYSLVGKTGGYVNHYHEYSQVPQHTHSYVESSHSHTYKRASDAEYGLSTASAAQYVSNPTHISTYTGFSSSRVNILPMGEFVCETDNSSSLPPYYKLGFIQASGNLEQIQESNPIELDWYWWIMLGSIGSLAIVVTISMLIRRKTRKSESIDEK